MQQMHPGWHAVQVRSQSEKMVAALLKYKGYDTFLPTYTRTTAERRNAEPKPLFPGYIFCRVGEVASGLIVTTPGVIQILGSGTAVQCIPDAEIDNLKRIVAAGIRVMPWPNVAVGMSACVIEGPLKGCTGVVIRTDGKTHLIVSVEILRRSISVRMDREWLEAVSPMPEPPGRIEKLLLCS